MLQSQRKWGKEIQILKYDSQVGVYPKTEMLYHSITINTTHTSDIS